MYRLLALSLMLSAAPALASDGEQDRTDDTMLGAPPETAEFRKPIWPAHLTADQHYRRGQTEKRIGIGLTITGSAFAVAGLVFAGLAFQSIGAGPVNRDQQPYLTLVYGVYGTLSGLAAVPFLASGIPLWRRGDRRMLQAQPFLDVDLRSSTSPQHVGLKINGQF